MILTITKEAEVTTSLIYDAVYKQLEIIADEANVPSTYLGTVSDRIKQIRSRLDLIDDLIKLHYAAIEAEEGDTDQLSNIGDQVSSRKDLADALKMVF